VFIHNSMQIILEYINQSYHKVKMTLKRTVTLDYPDRSKRARGGLSKKVAFLSRAVAAAKPELRQETFVIPMAIALNDPLALISSRTLQPRGTQEIRLHRVRVAWTAQIDGNSWATLYCPKNNTTTYSTHGLYNSASSHDVSNFLVPIDTSNAAVYKSKNFFLDNQYNSTVTSYGVLTLDHKFPIPKKIEFAAETTANPSTEGPIQQLYFIGGPRSSTTQRNIYVTFWYTAG